VKQLQAGLVALCVVGAPFSAARGDVFDDIGLTSLRASGQLRAEGAGVSVGQVEAMEATGGVTPDVFGKVFTPRGVPQGPVSNHATYVGNAIYGAAGVAPGVTQVSLFEAEAFLGSAALRSGSHAEPARLGVAVMNHSWIWDRAGAAQNRETLRRLDYQIARDDLLSVHAAANGPGSGFPVLLASSMNGVTVGLSDGSSSVGPVLFDLGGRGTIAKPDLVVPEQTTSRAAAIVSGAAALLMSEGRARGMAVGGLATKAILLAGAEHLDGYDRGLPGPADDRFVPFDFAQGAGELRVDRSFDILTAGDAEEDAAGRSHGWAARRIEGRRADFLVTLPEGGDLSAALAWHRKVTPQGGGFADGEASVADLDLILQRKSRGRWSLVDKSTSAADNVEIVTRSGLSAGEYRLVVTGTDQEAFALAWGVSSDEAPPTGTTVAVPEPSAAVACALAASFALGRRRRHSHFVK
jgi:hypothetical protein